VPAAEAASTLVSARRLGAALHAQRIAGGTTLTALSRRCDGWWTPDELLDVERGAIDLDDASVVSLCRLYGLPGRGLAEPADLELVLDRSGTAELATAAGVDEPTCRSTEPADVALARLVALAQLVGVDASEEGRWHGLLSDALSVPEGDVAASLSSLHADHARLEPVRECLADRIVVPAVGLLVAESAGGSLVLVRRAGGAVRAAHEPVPAAGPLRWFDAPLPLSA
jgi:hypothetical protein